MLTLPDGRVLPMEKVFAAIDAYCEQWPAVFALYDLSNPGRHDEVLPLDVLAPNALNAWGQGQPMTAMTNAWLVRERIEQAIKPISKTPLEELDGAQLPIEAEKVGAALEVIDEIKGYGWTSASKFFHRFRPNLSPIWDKWIAQWYSTKDDWPTWVQGVYANVREPGSSTAWRRRDSESAP